ncbi:phosphate signaling complex PhoU family protein [Mycobacterium genavense]|uniref:phosphate signaling complex PhoU family protein n=1 Tax=Mycobacterium genavense TaxID=36812 RepID=UPI000470F340|nr:PhoU domain-containing protein [Mycobacterium genavense]
MRTAFHHQLDALSQHIADMCDLSGTAMARATEALLGADLVRAETVISAHPDFVARVSQTETGAYNLLLQAPVATDLRAILGSLQNVADIYRMAALALHAADTARLRHPASALPDDVKPYFVEMGRIAVDLSRSATKVVLSGNPEQAAELADDDAMDELHRLVFTILMDRQWSHTVAAAVDVTLLSRYYERFADHAVMVGRRVIFQANGSHRTS